MDKTSKIVLIIKRHRKEKSLTQRQMAKIVGVTLRVYQRLESGYMPAWMIEEAAEHLGLKILALDKEVLK